MTETVKVAGKVGGEVAVAATVEDETTANEEGTIATEEVIAVGTAVVIAAEIVVEIAVEIDAAEVILSLCWSEISRRALTPRS
jgi:hypothetical protein